MAHISSSTTPAWNRPETRPDGDFAEERNLARRYFLHRNHHESSGAEEFGAIWATSPVRAAGHRTKTMTHPKIGQLRVHCDVLAIPEDDQQVVFITADPGTPSARALRHLLKLS